MIFTDIALVNKLRLEEMHLKTDELFKHIMAIGRGGKQPAAGVGAAEGAASGGGAAAAKGRRLSRRA